MGAIHNVIIILREQGMTQQQAYDTVDGLQVRDRLQEWYLRVSELPIYRETMDIQVQKYVTACREIAVGNLHWRLVSLIGGLGAHGRLDHPAHSTPI